MADEQQQVVHVTITEPQPDMATCVACGAEVMTHAAFRVSVRSKKPYVPGAAMSWRVGDAWSHTQTTWSAAQAAMLNATASVLYGASFPEPTHVIDTYTGYACSREHAESASAAKARTV